jgi:hypothetical protein
MKFPFAAIAAANLGEQLGWGIEVRGIEQLVDS